MARARSREGVGGLLEFVMADRIRPPLGRFGFGVRAEDDNACDDGSVDFDNDDDDGVGGGGGGGDGDGNDWVKRFPGISRLILSGIPSVSYAVLPVIYGKR